MAFTVKDWKDSPNTTTPLSAAALEDMETRLAAYTDAQLTAFAAIPIVNADVSSSAAIAESKLTLASDAAVGTASRRTLGTGALQAAPGTSTPTYQTSLPGSPVDGQEILYAAAATSGVIWHLRYRSAASGLYKWDYVGGSSLYHTVSTAQSGGSQNVWMDLTTVGPTITVPLAGDYIARAGVRLDNAYAGANRAFMGVALGAGTPPQYVAADLAANGHVMTLFYEQVYLAVTTSQELRMRYQQVNSAVSFVVRNLTVTPVRVG